MIHKTHLLKEDPRAKRQEKLYNGLVGASSPASLRATEAKATSLGHSTGTWGDGRVFCPQPPSPTPLQSDAKGQEAVLLLFSNVLHSF